MRKILAKFTTETKYFMILYARDNNELTSRFRDFAIFYDKTLHPLQWRHDGRDSV